MKLLKAGDRIKVCEDIPTFQNGCRGVINHVDYNSGEFFIKYYVTLETGEKYWFYGHYVELDIQYYRDKQIDKILNK